MGMNFNVATTDMWSRIGVTPYQSFTLHFTGPGEAKQSWSGQLIYKSVVCSEVRLEYDDQCIYEFFSA